MICTKRILLVIYLCAHLFASSSLAEHTECAIPANRERNWGSKYSECQLDATWEELAMQEYVCSHPQFTGCEIRFKTGGLGVLGVQGAFQAWVCVKEHACAEADGWFCFVYGELDEAFLPW